MHPHTQDVFLLITCVVMAVLLLVATVILVILFGHPNDANEAKLPKVVVVGSRLRPSSARSIDCRQAKPAQVVCHAGFRHGFPLTTRTPNHSQVLALWLTFASILILPYDVANSRGDGGGLRVDVLWQIVYITGGVLLTVLIPFAFFYYESDTEPRPDQGCLQSQLGSALAFTMAFFVVFTVILVILYTQLNTAEIPVQHLAQGQTLVFPVGSDWSRGGGAKLEPRQACSPLSPNTWCQQQEFDWEIPVTFPVYLIAFLGFIGWFFFTLFLGVGLTSLPLDLINEWRTRPEPISVQRYTEEKRKVGERADTLLRIGEAIQNRLQLAPIKTSRSQRRQDVKDLRNFEKHYYFLKKDWHLLELSRQKKDTTPLWYFLKLVAGVISGFLSLFWVLHIIIFMLADSDPFLNSFFIELESVGDGDFPLFGVIAFALFAFYLMWAVVKGNFKLGIRFLFWRIYPLELHNTMMNAFLANCWVLLLCSIPTVQFCTLAFPEYARYTDVNMIFGTQIQYLQFFRYFWLNSVFIITLLVLVGLSVVYLLARPRDKAAEIDRELKAIADKSIDELKRDL